MLQNDVIKCCKMMSSNVVLLHSNNCCVVLEPAICEDLDLHVAIFQSFFDPHLTPYFLVPHHLLKPNIPGPHSPVISTTPKPLTYQRPPISRTSTLRPYQSHPFILYFRVSLAVPEFFINARGHANLQQGTRKIFRVGRVASPKCTNV